MKAHRSLSPASVMKKGGCWSGWSMRYQVWSPSSTKAPLMLLVCIVLSQSNRTCEVRSGQAGGDGARGQVDPPALAPDLKHERCRRFAAVHHHRGHGAVGVDEGS